MSIEYRVDYALEAPWSDWTPFTTHETYREAKQEATALHKYAETSRGSAPKPSWRQRIAKTRVMKIEVTEIRIFPDQEDT